MYLRVKVVSGYTSIATITHTVYYNHRDGFGRFSPNFKQVIKLIWGNFISFLWNNIFK